MLYVFQVENGTMMTFDMNLALDTVLNLKLAIKDKIDIPVEKQVLLISGGESLSDTLRVCSYSSAGTDTSPIFLFIKSIIDNNQRVPQLPHSTSDSPDDSEDRDMRDVIESCMNMQPSLDTLVARTELAAKLNHQAEVKYEAARRLVHEQHLQQQAWSAVTANLEDLTRAFQNKTEIFMSTFDEFSKIKPRYIGLLNKFDEDMKHLENTPILPTLIDTNKSTSEPLPTSSTSSTSKTSDKAFINLREWIESHDNQHALKNLIELCWRGLDRFSDDNFKQIKQDIQEIIKTANDPKMMNIGPVGGRLYLMDTLMVNFRQVVEQQAELAKSFNNHRHSFSKAKDVTVLPDLSESHKVQLQLMLEHHEKVRDYRKRCYHAKLELCSNLMDRLRWIIFVEQKISDLDDVLMMHKENLVRLERRLQIVEQVHRAPELYLEAVAEVLRRQRFSSQYLQWANEVAKFTNELYTKELATRHAFDAKIGDHFLHNLFPGLTRSYPPAFANQAPNPFDTKLPKVTTADIEYLQSLMIDELAQKLKIPSEVPIPQIVYHSKAASVDTITKSATSPEPDSLGSEKMNKKNQDDVCGRIDGSDILDDQDHSNHDNDNDEDDKNHKSSPEVEENRDT